MKKLDQKYWKIIKYVVLCVTLMYISLYCVNLIFTFLIDMPKTIGSVKHGFSVIFKVLAPFMIGLIFAYLFDPVVNFLQTWYESFEEKHLKEHKEKKAEKIKKKGTQPKYKKRFAGTLILYLIIFLFVALFVLGIIHTIGGVKGSNVTLSTYLINTISSTTIALTELNNNVQQKLAELGISKYLSGAVEVVFNGIKGLSTSLVGFVGSIASGLFTSFLGLVMGFYILMDKEAFKQNSLLFIKTFLPDKAGEGLLSFLGTIHTVFSGYIRGQLLDATIYGTLIGISLTILGMPYALFIGLVSGFCNLIPYVGAFVAFALSITVGLFSGNPMLAVYSAVTIFVLQQLDSIYINPKCVSSKIDISPFLVIFSLSVGGALFGVVGMLFAVPVASLLKLFIGQFVQREVKEERIKKMLTKKENVEEV